MNKPNIFRSSKFFMDAGDTLHILVKDLVGSAISLSLNNGDDDSEEDTELIGTTVTPTTTTVPTTTGTDVVIEITHTKVGELMITLIGSDDVYIDWGDGDIEFVDIGDEEFYHTYVGGGTIQIYDAVGITQVLIQDDSITDVDIPAECVNIEYIEIASENLTTLPTHAEWVNLYEFAVTSLSGNPITTGLTITTHNTWVNLYTLRLSDFNLSTVITRSGWVNLNILELTDNIDLTTIDIKSEWVNLGSLVIENTALASVTIPVELVSLLTVAFINNAIISDVDINSILITLDTMAIPLTTVDLSGGTNATPTGLGITAKNNMIGRGIIVTTN